MVILNVKIKPARLLILLLISVFAYLIIAVRPLRNDFLSLMLFFHSIFMGFGASCLGKRYKGFVLRALAIPLFEVVSILPLIIIILVVSYLLGVKPPDGIELFTGLGFGLSIGFLTSHHFEAYKPLPPRPSWICRFFFRLGRCIVAMASVFFIARSFGYKRIAGGEWMLAQYDLGMFKFPQRMLIFTIAVLLILAFYDFLYHAWIYRKTLDIPSCDTCGYNLTGNTSGICPECGAKIDSKKLQQY